MCRILPSAWDGPLCPWKCLSSDAEPESCISVLLLSGLVTNTLPSGNSPVPSPAFPVTPPRGVFSPLRDLVVAYISLA